MQFSLNVQKRSVLGRKVKLLRAQGEVPAVLYGGDEGPLSLQLANTELDKLIASGGGLQLINLISDDLPATRVLMRDLQRHPVRRNILHVDFLRVAANVEIQTEVPLHFVGEAPVIGLGGIVLQNVDTVTVSCLPDDLPSRIVVDLSVLEDFGNQITAGDLPLPDDVELAAETGDEVIVSVTVPRAVAADEEEEAEEGVEGVEGVEPEVVGAADEEE